MKQSCSNDVPQGGMSRRQFLTASAAALAGAVIVRPGQAWAADYPAGRAIQFIVPFPAGGGTDLRGRHQQRRGGGQHRHPAGGALGARRLHDRPGLHRHAHREPEPVPEHRL
ncbi:hypothetical protein G6F22_014550 [Rhizopus arrhizus]|nr:hypothetical protein G6F22_014550 [Rhizopus arrhizus]